MLSNFATMLACADGSLQIAPLQLLSPLPADEVVQVASPPLTTAKKATSDQQQKAPAVSLFGPLPILPTDREPTAVPAKASKSASGEAKTAAPAQATTGWGADFLKV